MKYKSYAFLKNRGAYYIKKFKVPAKIIHEGNSIKYLEELKSDSVFIVTDKVMFELGMTKEIM